MTSDFIFEKELQEIENTTISSPYLHKKEENFKFY